MLTWRNVGILFLAMGTVAVADDLRENEAIFAGGTAESDGLWISGPSLLLRKNTPAVLAAMVKAPGKDRAYSYLLIVKGDEQRKSPANFSNRCRISRPVAESGGSLEIATRKVAFVYKAELDRTEPPTLKETFSVNGKTLDVSRGRVVLIDLTGDGVSMKQTVASLPASQTFPEKTEEVESQAKKLLDQLRRENKDVREFLK